jgi:hypothetical protein
MQRLSLTILALLLVSRPAAAESYAEGLRALHQLTLTPGNEISRNFFHLTRPGESPRLRWGRSVEGDEGQVGIDEEEPREALAEAKLLPVSHMRWCNFHVHRKSAVLRLQKERGERAPYGNQSFPPSGADVQLSLVGEAVWAEEGITGESTIGVLDSLGLWIFRELGLEQDPKRQALYRKHRFTTKEVEATKRAGGDASETLRYEYMKKVNARPRQAEEIASLPEYRQLVLRYAVLENVELAFHPISLVEALDPCRGF